MNRYPLHILLVVNVFLVVFALPGLFLFSAPRAGHAVDVSYLKGVTFGLLELTDLTGNQGHGESFTSILGAEMIKLQVIDVVAPKKMQSALASVGVAMGAQPTFDQILKAGKIAGTDIIITGTLNDYLMLSQGVSAISITLYAINVHSGKTVWSDNLTRSFENTNIIGEGAQMAATALVQRMVEGMEKQKRAMKRSGVGTAKPQPITAIPTAVPTVVAPTFAANPTVLPTTPAPTGLLTQPTPLGTPTGNPSVDAILQGIIKGQTATPRPTPPIVPTVAPRPTVGPAPLPTPSLLANMTPTPSPTIVVPTPQPTTPVPTPTVTVTPVATSVVTPTPKATKVVEVSTPKHRSGAVELITVYFHHGSSELSQVARDKVNSILGELKRKPKAAIVIEGHTDDTGTSSYNSYLAHSRANTVKAQLQRKGVDHRRIVTFGYGNRTPSASNETDAGKAKNRRAVILIHPDVDRVAGSGPVVIKGKGNKKGKSGKTAKKQQKKKKPMLGDRAREIMRAIRRKRMGLPPEGPDPKVAAAPQAGRMTPSGRVVPAKLSEVEARRMADRQLFEERSKTKLDKMSKRKIRPGDALRVKVAGHDELDKKVVISPRGVFSYNLINDFRASGMTLRRLTDRVQQKMKEFILNASVGIRRVHLIKVLGKVSQGGQFEFDHPPTILDVLAKVRGYRDLSVQHNRYTARIMTAEGHLFELDITKLLNTGKDNEKLLLFHGDTLILEPEEREKVYVLGAISNAIMYRQGMKLVEALVLARTSSRIASGKALSDEDGLNIKNVRILRKLEDGRILKIEINVHDILHRNRTDRNIPLQPGDYIIVPKRSQRKDVVSVIRNFISPILQTILLFRVF